jgi:hypothetical protein
MPNFIIAYHGGEKPETKEAGAAQMAKWKAWVDDLGDACVNPGTPLGQSRIVSAVGISDDGGPNPMSGFSVVMAADIDAALEMAKRCPFLDIGGTLEVAEMMEMS